STPPSARKRLIRADETSIGQADWAEITAVIGNNDGDALIKPRRDSFRQGSAATQQAWRQSRNRAQKLSPNAAVLCKARPTGLPANLPGNTRRRIVGIFGYDCGYAAGSFQESGTYTGCFAAGWRD